MSNENNKKMIAELEAEVERRSNRNQFRFCIPDDAKYDDDTTLEDNADLAGLYFLQADTGLSREQIESIVDKVSGCRHPANTNPTQTPAELAALYRSMASGYDDKEPVIVAADKYVDGVNREIVAELIRAKRQPEYECAVRTIADGDAAKIVKARNARRNLPEAGKAFQAAHTLRKGGKHGAQKELALDVGVSTRLIRAARAVLEKIPELEGHILAGRLALMAGEKIAHSKQHLTEAQEYLSKREADTSPFVRRKLVDIAKRAEQALATQDRLSTLLADVKKASNIFYSHFKQQIENEAEPETAHAINSILKSPKLLEAMVAASKDPEHDDKTLAQLVALITDKSEPPAAPAERSSTTPQGNGPCQSRPKGNATHADYSPIFNELEALTEELLREKPLPPQMRKDLVMLLREKADLVEKA
jgi:hypothetical protein